MLPDPGHGQDHGGLEAGQLPISWTKGLTMSCHNAAHSTWQDWTESDEFFLLSRVSTNAVLRIFISGEIRIEKRLNPLQQENDKTASNFFSEH